MRYNVCIIQPPGYVHALAFLELAELITYSLRDLGHEARLEFNRLDANDINILIGCHLLEAGFLSHVPRSTIVLNTEQIAADESHWHRNIYEYARHFPVWDYSPRNIERLATITPTPPKHLNLGFQKELARIAPAPSADIDVLFYGSVNERRLKILQELEARGLKVTSVFGVYGAERDALIARAKLVLNLHMYKSEIFEIVRVFYLLTNGVAVVGEVGANTDIDPMYAEGIVAAPYEGLVDACAALAADPLARAAVQARARATLARFPQSRFTQAVL